MPADLGRVDECERVVAEIFVDVPDVLAAAIGRHREQPSAPISQPKGGQPALRHQPLALCHGRLQSLGHDGAPEAADLEPIDLRFEAPEADPVGRVGAFQQLLQNLAQLGGSRLASRLDRASEVPAQLDHFGHAADLALGSSARSRTRPTTRRASKCSSASARASRQCRP